MSGAFCLLTERASRSCHGLQTSVNLRQGETLRQPRHLQCLGSTPAVGALLPSLIPLADLRELCLCVSLSEACFSLQVFWELMAETAFCGMGAGDGMKPN